MLLLLLLLMVVVEVAVVMFCSNKQQGSHSPWPSGIIMNDRGSRNGQSSLDMRHRPCEEPGGGMSRLRGVRLGQRRELSRYRGRDHSVGEKFHGIVMFGTNHRAVHLSRCVIHRGRPRPRHRRPLRPFFIA